jgi:FkbM family methyltransferase
MKNTFLTAYAECVTACAGNDHRDNHDWRRFGPAPFPTLSRERLTATWAGILLKRLGLVRAASLQQVVRAAFAFIAPHVADLQWLYEQLCDSESRDLLVQLMAYRALGEGYIKLPLNRPEHWELVERIEKSAANRETIDPNFNGWRLSKIDLREIGYPIELFLRPTNVVAQFIEQQYRCVTPEMVVEVGEGDRVIDAGGCWGDTALYFAHKAGPEGRVISFEFLPQNLTIYRRNLELNSRLAERIEVLRHPVWSSSDRELFINPNGPGTTVGSERGATDVATVRTLSIDGLLERGDLEWVDFIKMDIEGAELEALKGAEGCLRKFRPRMAVTVYHGLTDFWTIPQYLSSLNLGYRFYLRHFTIHAEETILFAAPI